MRGSVEQQGLRRLPHMAYQKSSAALDLATQLIDGGKCLLTNPILTQRAQKAQQKN
jgi:hypothetical protein